jgi:hypothetical protein
MWVLLVTGCLLRGGAIATYRPGGAGAEVTATAGLGGRTVVGDLETAGGGAFSLTASAGYDGRVGAPVASWGPSFEFYTAGDRWSLASLLTCGARVYAKHVRGDLVDAGVCELRLGPSYLSDFSSRHARWASIELVVRYAAFGTTDDANGWTFGIAGTWEHWMTDRSPRYAGKGID